MTDKLGVRRGGLSGYDAYTVVRIGEKRDYRIAIAECFRDDAEKYARLFAAAPDLLDAAEAAMRISSLWLPAPSVLPEHDSEAIALTAMAKMLRAAIAKAKNSS